MSDPDSASMTLTTRADEITTPPEKMSLVYEELFDDESSNGTPCYLPDRPENGLLISPNGSGVPEIDYVDKEGTPDTQSNDEQDGSSEPPDCDSETEQLQKKAESIEYDDIAEANDGIKHDTDKINQDEFEEIVALEGSSHKSLDKPERGVGTVQIHQDASPCSLDDVGEQAIGSRGTNAGRVEDTNTEVGPADVGLTSTKGEMDVPIKNFIHEKQHEDEDDTSASWRKHKKHFFILSHAGKPIYSRYGDEHKLAGFSATLQAIISFVENSGDCIRFIRARDHQIVFLVKGPIYLVSVSATDEPVWALRGQLELLHGQLLLILTKGLERCFVKNSNFDLRPLLGGTEIVFASLIRSFSWNPASFLHSYTCLQLPHTARQAAGAALQDVADTDLLFALLLAGSKVISLIGTQKSSLHPDDILLLSNFVASSESFRTTESFSPVCLPNYNAMAFLYAYIHYLDADTCLILITSNSDAFFHLKECRVKIETFLREAHVLSDIAHSVQNGGLRVEDLPGDVLHGSGQFTNRTCEPDMGSKERAGVGGAGGLWHFIYRSVYLDQYAASKFSPPLHTRKSQKQLLRAYERLHASMHGGSGGSRQMQYQRDETHVLLAWSTTDFEFFAAFDPLAEKSTAITVCNRVCQWIRDVESDIFFLGANIFNW